MPDKMLFYPKKFFEKFHGRHHPQREKLNKKRELEKALGVTIKNEELFSEALTHRSALSTSTGAVKRSNERMEYLGDAILDFLIAEILFEEFPGLDEGQMTRLRSLLVNQHALAECATKINLSYFLELSSSALQAIEKGYETIISDAFEAILAAIYLDGGIKAARKFVANTVIPRKEQVGSEAFDALDKNFKSALLEFSQARGLGSPRYNLIKEEGPDHDRTFTIEVLIGDEPHGIGTGKTKKAAEQAAAAMAFEKLKQKAK